MMEKRILKYVNKSPNPDLAYGKYDKNGNSGNSGFDLYAWIDGEPITIKPLDRALVHTGIYLEIPEDCEIQIRSRSGYSLQYGIVVANSPATIDSNYTGELCVIVHNLSNDDFTVHNGDRVAQAVLCPVFNGHQVSLMNTEKIKENRERGSQGFASSGF